MRAGHIMLQERHYQGSMYRNVTRQHKYQARWYTRHARQVTRGFLTALRHPTLKQMVFWKARGVHQMPCSGQWVRIHAETLERFYRATVAHATRCFTIHSLREWKKQILQQVQVFWECKRDLFEFHVAQCTAPRGPSALGGNVSAPGIFCDPCPTGALLPLICWATLYGFAPWPPVP